MWSTTCPLASGPGRTRRMCTGVLWMVHISQLQERSLMIISRGLETSSKRRILRYILENVPQDSNRRRERDLPETAGLPREECPTASVHGWERPGRRRDPEWRAAEASARGLSCILQAMSRDGWDCPSNTFKVTRLPPCPSASKSRGIYSPSQRWCQRQRLLI